MVEATEDTGTPQYPKKDNGREGEDYLLPVAPTYSGPNNQTNNQIIDSYDKTTLLS